MRSTIAITTAATDLSLLTVQERRAAAGLTSADSSKDSELAALDLRVGAAICAECNVAAGPGKEPTLLRETITETFRGVRCGHLILSRRHDITITSVSVDGALIDAGSYDVDPESGILYRLAGFHRCDWQCSTAVIVYVAGFAAAPQVLKAAAIETMTAFWRDAGRDPYVKGTIIDIPDVESIRTEMWAGTLPGQFAGAVPPGAMVQLGRFRNIGIA